MHNENGLQMMQAIFKNNSIQFEAVKVSVYPAA